MVKLDICGWCQHYNGLIDAWLPSCKAFPDGLPHPKEFKQIEGIECNNGISFEVNEAKHDSFMQISHNDD